MLEYNPDVIIAVGGGSVMSAAKAMWLLYENPDLDLNEVADKFSSLDGEYDANYADFPDTGKKSEARPHRHHCRFRCGMLAFLRFSG